jgi:hypothetical protein
VVRLIAAGSSEQTRNRVPTADRTRWFDQRASAEKKCWVLATHRLSNDVTPFMTTSVASIDATM